MLDMPGSGMLDKVDGELNIDPLLRKDLFVALAPPLQFTQANLPAIAAFLHFGHKAFVCRHAPQLGLGRLLRHPRRTIVKITPHQIQLGVATQRPQQKLSQPRIIRVNFGVLQLLEQVAAVDKYSCTHKLKQ